MTRDKRQTLIQGSQGLQAGNTTRQCPGGSEEERKAKSSYSKKLILEKLSPAFLSPGLARDRNLPDVQWSGKRMSEGLDL